MIAYKLMRVRANGTVTSLFINKSKTIPIGEWVEAKAHPTKGFAFRPGWHATNRPIAPHLSERGRMWFKVELKDVKRLKRPESQGGEWYLARHMRIVGWV